MRKFVGMIALVFFISLAMVGVRQAQALTMTLDSGADHIVVLDNGTGDMLGTTDGAILFAGSVGDFFLNTETGKSLPVIGVPAAPMLDLSSSNTSSGAGTLVITLEDTYTTDMGALVQGISSAFGGTAQGGNTVSMESFLNGVSIAALGPLGGLSYSDDVFTSITPAAGPYDLKLVMTIVHGAAGGDTTFDANVTVPEPGTILLLGSALLGLGLVNMKRRRG